MSTSAGAAGWPARSPNRIGTGTGSAFFGWLAAAGTTVLLSGVATSPGAALLANNGIMQGVAEWIWRIVISAVIAAPVALGGTILGGLAGMRFHRRVDRAGLGA